MVIDNQGNSLNNRIISNKPSIAGTGVGRPLQQRQNAVDGGFENIFRQKLNESSEIKFSKHAESRLQERNISLTQLQRNKMKDAVAKAESKGVRDSLVLMDNMAFVVNVKNKTVITAANSNDLKENVFTNIDGAVIV